MAYSIWIRLSPTVIITPANTQGSTTCDNQSHRAGPDGRSVSSCYLSLCVRQRTQSRQSVGLARKFHPDVSKEPEAEQRMQEVNEARAVVHDPEKRLAYEQLGQQYQSGQDFHPSPGWDAGFEFSDFFANLFGQRG